MIAVLTALGGVLQLLTQIPVVHSRLDGREAEFGPLWVPVAGHVVSVIVGLLLLLLADQLAKRKRLAWRVAVAVFAVGRRRARAEGAAPGGASRSAPGCWWRWCWYRHLFRAPAGPTVAAAPGPVRPALPGRRAAVRVRGAVGGARAA